MANPDEQLSPISQATGVRAVPRRFILRLVHGDLTERRADCFAVNRYLGVPTTGAARAVDQFMGGTLEAFAQINGFNEQPFSISFLPARYAPFSADTVAVISMGEYERFRVAEADVMAQQWIRQQLQLVGRNLAASCCHVDLRDVASTVHGAGPNSKVDPARAVRYFLTGYLQGLKDYARPGQSYFLTLVELELEKIERFRLGIESAIVSGDCPLLQPAVSAEDLTAEGGEPWAWFADLDLVPVHKEAPTIPYHLRVGALIQSNGALKLSTIGTSSADQAIFDEYPQKTVQEVRSFFEKLHERSLRDLTGLQPYLQDESSKTRAGAFRQIEEIHIEARKTVAQYGTQLFNEIFDAEAAAGIRQRLLATEASRLLLRLDESTAGVPWELMVLDDRMLALERSIGRQLELVGQVRQPPPRDENRGGRLKILIVSNPTRDLPEVEKESRRILESLYKLAGLEVQVTALFGDEAMRQYIVPLLNEEYDVFHFAGHAFFDPTRPSESGLLLAGGDLFSAEMMWELPTPPSLVFFNACESAATIESTQTPPVIRDGQYVTELPLGSISALLRAGTRNFIGTQWRVADSVAAELAIAFYVALAEGRSVGEALRRARLSIIKRLGFGHLSWASYVLYGSPWNRPLE